MHCFFCDVQELGDPKIFIENELFFCRFDDFPVSLGHCEIILKHHVVSVFDLSFVQWRGLFEILQSLKTFLHDTYHSEDYTIGVNEGKAAGRVVDHFHVHVIPRYKRDVSNPEGGVRNVILTKGKYVSIVKKDPMRKKYVL